MSGFLDKIGLRPGGLWFNNQPIFEHDSIKIRPVLETDYLPSTSRFSSSRSSSIFFKVSKVGADSFIRVKCILKKYEFISIGKESVYVKIKGCSNKFVDFIFLKLLPTIGLFRSYIEPLECYLPILENCLLFLKFKKTCNIRKSKRRLLHWLTCNIYNFKELLAERVECLLNNNPIIVRIKLSSPTGNIPMYMDFLDKHILYDDSLKRQIFFEGFIYNLLNNNSNRLRSNNMYGAQFIINDNDNDIIDNHTNIKETRICLIELPKDAALRDVQNIKNVAISINKVNFNNVIEEYT